MSASQEDEFELNPLPPDIDPLVKAKMIKLKNNRFLQQNLPAWRPVSTFRSTLVTFIVIGSVFLALGILLWMETLAVVEVE
ncbi:MAG: hypothetical protein COA94_08880 [Rickettsiales bacterium]|nr:MAG: hypothetical protein COA94_08880 [Rickettsiales bacterium]